MIDAPATGAWRPGDPPGRRKFVSLFGDGRRRTLRSRPRGRRAPARGHGRLRDVGDTRRPRLERGPRPARVERRLAREPGRSSRATRAPAGGARSIGPGAPIDTDRYFVVCPNVLGGCQGTTGPSSWAEDGRPYGSRFPVVTVKDQVAVERALAAELGIETWYAVTGGSMGGMRALQWAVDLPRPRRAGGGRRDRRRRERRADRSLLAPEPGDPPRPGLPRRGLLRRQARTVWRASRSPVGSGT